ncbi:MAG: hypothetical protein DHS20C13_21850 [Thermodesulfobacteriota bacterium]|nr:MAG: hypothetical protein DHS20C13_21850 [Thermodesulfobacteriota bacterium]
MRKDKSIFVTLLFILVSVPITIACVSRGIPTSSTMSQAGSNSGQESEVSDINSKLLTHSSNSINIETDYLIGPSDLLEIKVLEAEKLDTTERVDANGYINLSLIDDVQVKGLTPIRAEEKIEMLLKDGGYINNPHVNVFVVERKSNTVSVLGYVNEPGNYELIGKVTLLDALALAKGLDKEAGTTVYITREIGKRQEKIVVDLDELFEKTSPSNQANLLISSGDKIYVPEASDVFVDGAVGRPGSYPIDDGETTLSQAISMAGGLASYANQGDVSLIRYLGDGRKEVVTVDLNSIREGTMQDPVLNEKDAIVVGSSGFKSFFYGLNVMMFGFGGGYHPPSR